jgi:hypothetical protein
LHWLVWCLWLLLLLVLNRRVFVLQVLGQPPDGLLVVAGDVSGPFGFK